MTKKVGEFKQGGGLDPSTTLGPLIGHSAVDRVRSKHMLTTPQSSSCRERALSRLAPCQSQLARCSAQTFNASTLTGHHPIMPSFAHESFVWSMFKSHMRLGMCRWQHMWRTLSPRAPKSQLEERSPTCQSHTTRYVAQLCSCALQPVGPHPSDPSHAAAMTCSLRRPGVLLDNARRRPVQICKASGTPTEVQVFL